MDSFKSEVTEAVAAALKEMGAGDIVFQTEVPSVEGADLAVPCFTMAKALRKAPAAIAQDLAGKISPKGSIASVSAVNGYLN
ncbi:MAG: arginine--tRNA ligase, partial [Candidatus Methanomethylophilaceae archaeon]|nr:arginine--tRNA ligase [Candidatus Methanomethylophilaceae archaeon]